MGRMSLLIASAIIIFSGMTFVSIQDINQRSVENNAEYALKSKSHSAAENLVEQMIQNFIQTGNTGREITNFGGENKKIYGKIELLSQNSNTNANDTIRIVARDSTYSDNYTIVEEAIFVFGNEDILTQAPPMGLVGDLGVSIVKGNVTFNGWDEGDSTNGGVAPITVTNEDDINQIENTVGQNGQDNLQGPNDGQIEVNDTYSNNFLTDLSSVLANNADNNPNVSNGNGNGNGNNGKISGNQQWGTSDNPQITHVDGDLTATGNVNGNGILSVNGSINVRGNFDWNGLVLLTGNGEDLTFSAKGNPTIRGGMVATTSGIGNDLNFDTRGNVNLIRNSDNLEEAQNLIDESDLNDIIENQDIVNLEWSSKEDHKIN